jgi:hypothetical protein
MDSLRMVDEWQSFSGLVSDETVYVRAGGFEATAPLVGVFFVCFGVWGWGGV